MFCSRKNRVDVILATYVFDSIWFSEDYHLEKKNNTWFQAEYKLSGTLINKSTLTDLKKIKIK